MLDPAANREVTFARHNFGSGDIGCFEARRTETVNLDTRCRLGISRLPNGGPRDDSALFAYWRDTAKSNIFNFCGIDIIPVPNGFENLCG